MPHPSYVTTLERDPVHIVQEAGLDKCGKSCPPPDWDIRPPDCPARSKSLYRLHYPGPPIYIVITKGLSQQIDRHCCLMLGLKCHRFVGAAQGCKDKCLFVSY